MTKESISNGNGTLKKISMIITLAVLIVGVAVAWGTLRTMVDKTDTQVTRLEEKKLDKEVYYNDIRDIKDNQIRTNEKLDKVLEKL